MALLNQVQLKVETADGERLMNGELVTVKAGIGGCQHPVG